MRCVVVLALIVSCCAMPPPPLPAEPRGGEGAGTPCSEVMSRCTASESCAERLRSFRHKCRKALKCGLRRHCSESCAEAYDKLVGDVVGADFDLCRCDDESKKSQDCSPTKTGLFGNSQFVRACRAKHGERKCAGRGTSCRTSHDKTIYDGEGSRRQCKVVLKECSVDKCCRERLYEFLYGNEKCTQLLGYYGIGSQPTCSEHCKHSYELLTALPLGAELLTCACHDLGSACIAEGPRRNFEKYCVECNICESDDDEECEASPAHGHGHGGSRRKREGSEGSEGGEEAHSHKEEKEEEEEGHSHEEGEEGEVESCADVTALCMEDDECRCLLTRARACTVTSRTAGECSNECINAVADFFCHPLSQKFQACDCDSVGPLCSQERQKMLTHSCAVAAASREGDCPSVSIANCPKPTCELALAYCISDSECSSLFNDLYSSRQCSPALTDFGVVKPPPHCPACCRERFQRLINHTRAKFVLECDCTSMGTFCTMPRTNYFKLCLAPKKKPTCKEIADKCDADPTCKELKKPIDDFIKGADSVCGNVFGYAGYAPPPVCSDECIAAEKKLRGHPIGAEIFLCDCDGDEESCARPKRNFALHCSTCPRQECPKSLLSACHEDECKRDLQNFVNPNGPCAAILSHNPNCSSSPSKPKCNTECVDAAIQLVRHHDILHTLDCEGGFEDSSAVPISVLRTNFISSCPNVRPVPGPQITCSSGCLDVVSQCQGNAACRVVYRNFGETCADVVLHDPTTSDPKCTAQCVQARKELSEDPIGQALATCHCQDVPACVGHQVNFRKFCLSPPKPKCSAIQEKCNGNAECKKAFDRFLLPGSPCENVFKFVPDEANPTPTCSSECVDVRNALIGLEAQFADCECAELRELCSYPRAQYEKYCPLSSPKEETQCVPGKSQLPKCSAIQQKCNGNEECKKAFETFLLPGSPCDNVFKFVPDAENPTPTCSSECIDARNALIAHEARFVDCDCAELGPVCNGPRGQYEKYCPSPKCSTLQAKCNENAECKKAFDTFLLPGSPCENIFKFVPDEATPTPTCSPECVDARNALIGHEPRLADCDCGLLGELCSKPRAQYEKYCPLSCLTRQLDAPSQPKCSAIQQKCNGNEECKKAFEAFLLPGSPCDNVFKFVPDRATPDLTPDCSPECVGARNALIHNEPEFADCDCDVLGQTCSNPRTQYEKYCPSPCSKVVEQCSADKGCSEAMENFLSGSACTTAFESQTCTVKCVLDQERLYSDPIGHELHDSQCDSALGELFTKRTADYAKYCGTCNRILQACSEDDTCAKASSDFFYGENCKPVLGYTDGIRPPCTHDCLRYNIALLQHPFGRLLETCDCKEGPDNCESARNNFYASCPNLVGHSDDPSSCSSMLGKCFHDAACSEVFNRLMDTCGDVFVYAGSEGDRPPCRGECRKLRAELEAHMGQYLDECDCGEDGQFCTQFQANLVSCQRESCDAVSEDCRQNLVCANALQSFLDGESCASVVYYRSGKTPACSTQCFQHYLQLDSRFETCRCGEDATCTKAQRNYLKFCPTLSASDSVLKEDSDCRDVVSWCLRHDECRPLHVAFSLACNDVLSFHGKGIKPVCSSECKMALDSLNAFLEDKPASLLDCKCRQEATPSAKLCSSHRNNIASICLSSTPDESCSDVAKECAENPSCLELYNSYKSNCDDVISGETITCSAACIQSYFGLVVHPIGRNFECCTCGDESELGCENGRLRGENHCPSMKCSAEHKSDSCSHLFANCAKSESCSELTRNFNRECANVIMHFPSATECPTPPECSSECKAAALALNEFFAEYDVDLYSCNCGGSETAIGSACKATRYNIAKFC